MSVVAATTLTCVSGAVAAPSTGAEARPPYPLKQAIIVGSISTLADYLADRGGVFLKHGIQVRRTPVTNVTTAVQVLAAGEAEVSVLDVPNYVGAREAGFDQVFIVGHWGRSPSSIVCQKSLNFTADTASGSKVDTTYPAIMRQLIGKRVGVNIFGGPPDTYLRITLLESGIDPGQVNILSTGSTGATTAAMASGNLDCALMGEPNITQLSSSTTTILNYAIGQGPAIFRANYAFSMISTTPRFAASHPTLVRNIARAFVESERMICGSARSKAGATRIAEIVAPDYPGIDIPTLTQVIQNVAPAACDSWHIGRNVVGGAVQVWNRLHPTERAVWPYREFIAPQVLDLTGPRVKLLSATRNGSTVIIAWTGVDKVGPYDVSDIASGLRGYTLQTSINGGPWVTRLAGVNVTAHRLHASPSSKIRVRIRGRDRAGNDGSWAELSI